MFPIVVPRIFLSLRYGADLGHSRLVHKSRRLMSFIESLRMKTESTYCDETDQTIYSR